MRCKIRTETFFFARDGREDLVHAIRVDGYAYSKSLLANTICSRHVTTDTR